MVYVRGSPWCVRVMTGICKLQCNSHAGGRFVRTTGAGLRRPCRHTACFRESTGCPRRTGRTRWLDVLRPVRMAVYIVQSPLYSSAPDMGVASQHGTATRLRREVSSTRLRRDVVAQTTGPGCSRARCSRSSDRRKSSRKSSGRCFGRSREHTVHR